MANENDIKSVNVTLNLQKRSTIYSTYPKYPLNKGQRQRKTQKDIEIQKCKLNQNTTQTTINKNNKRKNYKTSEETLWSKTSKNANKAAKRKKRKEI